MKYYYKIFVQEGVEESLKSIKASEKFIKELTESSNFKCYVEDGLTEFYVAYDVEKIRKGKSAWTWSSIKDYYRVNWTYKGEVHPKRKDAIKNLKEIWDNE